MTFVDGDYRDYLLGSTAEYNKVQKRKFAKLSLKQRQQLTSYLMDESDAKRRVERDSEETSGEGPDDDPVAPI
tara:strand:- start:444 stop:662 length:219 start_codon:yes stop_codon:yes gene_type:complete